MADNQSTYTVFVRTGHKAVVHAERWETDNMGHIFLDGNVKKAWFFLADVSFVVRGDVLDVSKS